MPETDVVWILQHSTSFPAVLCQIRPIIVAFLTTTLREKISDTSDVGLKLSDVYVPLVLLPLRFAADRANVVVFCLQNTEIAPFTDPSGIAELSNANDFPQGLADRPQVLVGPSAQRWRTTFSSIIYARDAWAGEGQR